MAAGAEVEELASGLSATRRSALVCDPPASLPPVLSDDEAMANALRRDAGMEANAGVWIGLERPDQEFGLYHP